MIKREIGLGKHSEINFKKIPIVDSRVRFIPEYCEGKNVLSIGCVDMIEASPLDEIIKSGNHQLYNLREKCKHVVGIDINEKGIELLKIKKFDVYRYDVVLDSLEHIEREEYDVVVVSHVIEHIPDMYKFLMCILKKFKFKEIIIAVPNSYNFYNIINMCIKNKEVVSNDHYYTFSPITLIKLMSSIGLNYKKLYFDREIQPRFKPSNIILRKIYMLMYKKILNKNGNLIYIGTIK
jgi:2-polyprenyl-3-methyl-5-hydroxy-6-metoxy-1,4-benzoquinol methylase